jgi:hypothetical protein
MHYFLSRLFAEAAADGADSGTPAAAPDGGAPASNDGSSRLLNPGAETPDAGTADAGNESPAPAGDDPAPADAPAWSWSEGIAGEGDRPEWLAEGFNSVAEQAQAAAELIGAPESYALPEPPEGLAGQFDTNDPLLQGFQKLAKEMNLSQAMHDKVVAAMAGVIAEQNDIAEASTADALAALGPNVGGRVAAVERYMTSVLGEHADPLANAIGNDPAAFRALEAIVARASGDAQLAGANVQPARNVTLADANAERFKVFPEGHPKAGKMIYMHDKEHRAKVDAMYKEVAPGDDIQIVG